MNVDFEDIENSPRPYGARDNFRWACPRVPDSFAKANESSTLGYFQVVPPGRLQPRRPLIYS